MVSYSKEDSGIYKFDCSFSGRLFKGFSLISFALIDYILLFNENPFSNLKAASLF
jgi:hypothetical protein